MQKKTLIYIILAINILSCKKPITYVETETSSNIQKTLVTDTSGYYSNPRFQEQFMIIVNGDFVNNSGQNIENLVIHPKIILDYEDNVKYELTADTIILNKIIKKNLRMDWENSFYIKQFKNFKDEILIHTVKNASLTMQIYGMNSVGYNSNNNDNSYETKINITENWNSIVKFKNDTIFPDQSNVFNNYAKQFNQSMQDFNLWNEEDITKMEEQYKKPIKEVFNSGTSFWSKSYRLDNFKKYHNILFSNFFNDYKKASQNVEFENEWRNFEKNIDSMYWYREKMDLTYEKLINKVDSIRKPLRSLPIYKEYIRTLVRKGDKTPQSHIIYKQEEKRVFEPYKELKEANKDEYLTYKANYLKHRERALKNYAICHDRIVENLEIENTVKNFKVF